MVEEGTRSQGISQPGEFPRRRARNSSRERYDPPSKSGRRKPVTRSRGVSTDATKANANPAGGWLIKTGSPDDPEVLRREYEFLSSLPLRFKPPFPNVWGFVAAGAGTQYRMEKFPFPSLAEGMFRNPGDNGRPRLDPVRALAHLRSVLSFLVAELYPTAKNGVPGDFLDRAFVQRFEQRKAAYLAHIQNDLAQAGMLSDAKRYYLHKFRKLLNARKVKIDGELCLGAEEILRKIQASPRLREMLTPPSLYTIHGDLSFQNILVDVEDSDNRSFRLIDPLPQPGGGDVARDVGVLLMSSQCGIEFFCRGYFDLQIFEYNRTFALNTKLWGDRPRVEVRPYRAGHSKGQILEPVLLLDGTERAAFEEIGHQLPGLAREILAGSKEFQNDEHCLLRARFNQAAVLCRIPPSHLEASPKRAIALHARGLKMLNEFLEENSRYLKR